MFKKPLHLLKRQQFEQNSTVWTTLSTLYVGGG